MSEITVVTKLLVAISKRANSFWLLGYSQYVSNLFTWWRQRLWFKGWGV